MTCIIVSSIDVTFFTANFFWGYIKFFENRDFATMLFKQILAIFQVTNIPHRHKQYTILIRKNALIVFRPQEKVTSFRSISGPVSYYYRCGEKFSCSIYFTDWYTCPKYPFIEHICKKLQFRIS